METINGEWYMKGCAAEDPQRLRSPEEAADLIKEIGFMPLFANEIPGFSIEERTLAEDWWKDDPACDPWAWRQILARREDLVYGKFFDRRAGFVSAECFACFANYRRRGYDFDTLTDEGLAPIRAAKLMRPFLTDGMPNELGLHSYLLKAQAGFGPGGEKNFEGVLTDLQMQSFLCIGDFRQRLNKRGAPYGWHIAVIETPEAKLGYETVTAAYREAPKASWDWIVRQIRRFFPSATEPELRRWLGGKSPSGNVD